MFSRWLPFALMLQLVVAHLHCLCHHDAPALVPTSVVRASRSQPMPEHHCHNEFGCICKGALVVECTQCAAPELTLEYALPPTQLLSSALGHDTPAALEIDPGPLLFGRILRAQFSSFLI